MHSRVSHAPINIARDEEKKTLKRNHQINEARKSMF